ncbi:outer membrane beta-barrel protein [Photobacterium sp. GJ3]|uniref:outer membrane beta-barrel protein n=1 Tax=Photobacterium sp. GJ3 TaxID=2829502 RepID=UPI001B8B6F1D|nr:outer membrane beta-barrel protein [Photobacterium sp. GJ3]QUJ66165.1 outer membrane beta-barrel protein [Photobacterium sp. GJ3]
MKKTLPLAMLITGIASFSAQAESYLGASLGQSSIKSVEIQGRAFGMSGSQSYDASESMLSGSLFAGYNFNPYLGVEFTVGGMDAIDDAYLSVGDMMYFALQPKLSLPLTDAFSVYAKAGIARFSAEFIANNGAYGYSGYTTVSTSDTTLMAGLGAEYALTEHLRIRASWDYMKPELELIHVADASLSVEPEFQQFSVGLSYHF